MESFQLVINLNGATEQKYDHLSNYSTNDTPIDQVSITENTD